MNAFFTFSRIKDFSSGITLDTPQVLSLPFETPHFVCSQNFDELSQGFKVFVDMYC